MQANHQRVPDVPEVSIFDLITVQINVNTMSTVGKRVSLAKQLKGEKAVVIGMQESLHADSGALRMGLVPAGAMARGEGQGMAGASAGPPKRNFYYRV